MDVLFLAPPDYRAFLTSFPQLTERSDATAWINQLASAIVHKAFSSGARTTVNTACPLCGSVSLGGAGFANAQDLLRHLVGHNQCPVMRAAEGLAWNPLDRRPDDAAERDRESADMPLETGLSTHATQLDGDMAPRTAGADHRTAVSLEWAEQRLLTFGFKIEASGERKIYKRQISLGGRALVVYANPRRVGKIMFRVYDTAATDTAPLITFAVRDTRSQGTFAEVLQERIESAWARAHKRSG